MFSRTTLKRPEEDRSDAALGELAGQLEEDFSRGKAESDGTRHRVAWSRTQYTRVRNCTLHSLLESSFHL